MGCEKACLQFCREEEGGGVHASTAHLVDTLLESVLLQRCLYSILVSRLFFFLYFLQFAKKIEKQYVWAIAWLHNPVNYPRIYILKGVVTLRCGETGVVIEDGGNVWDL